MKLDKASITLPTIQTGKLGGFRQDLGGARAVKSKGRGEKSDPGVDSRAARGAEMNLTQRADSTQGWQRVQKRMLPCTCQMNIDI